MLRKQHCESRYTKKEIEMKSLSSSVWISFSHFKTKCEKGYNTKTAYQGLSSLHDLYQRAYTMLI